MKKEIKKKVEKVVIEKETENKTSVYFWSKIALLLLGVIIFGQLFTVNIEPRFDYLNKFISKSFTQNADEKTAGNINVSELENTVLPSEGVDLQISWEDLGKRMVADGVIDEQKFRTLFQDNLQSDEEQILSGVWNDKIVMTQQNSRFLLNMLWAFGLANKNDILENGEMVDEKYGGDASGFASTGGWSLSRGDVMNHYSNYTYVTLTSEQQEIVDRVSSGIYRPCCGNSTHFPDCNHGMAMLGLLELMAVNNVSEQEMYDVALAVNSIWFPQTYIDLATYFEEQGQDWNEVDAKIVLGSEYSSGQGYRATREKIESLPEPQQGGGGCGV